MATRKRSTTKPRKTPEPGTPGHQLSRDEAYAYGKNLRESCPREAHAKWRVARDRPDAVDLVRRAEKGRVARLLPLRHGRMAASPFTFYRGAALTMAHDLAPTPVSGLRVQCCGDAHLCNFGGFATPERRIIFSINDLDETLPAPWEWDLKRLAASFVVASRAVGLKEGQAIDTARTAVRTYREAMAELSELRTLDLWYTRMDADEMVAAIKDPEIRKRGLKRLQKERAHSIAEDTYPKLVEHQGEKPLIRDQPPTIFHVAGSVPGELEQAVAEAFAGYRESLSTSYRSLLDRFEIADCAVKVVGVGSVGTACWVLLLMAGEGDPLFLQVKEARASVFEPYAGRSEFANHGQRVVHGYRLMQPASDLFLGWTRGEVHGRHYFVRQLRDMKISLRVETFGFAEMELDATWCGRALALAHARSGSSAMLAGYMGRSDAFEEAVAQFSVRYADQNEKDHAALRRAIRAGKLEAEFEA